jgi:hypothetical protein
MGKLIQAEVAAWKEASCRRRSQLRTSRLRNGSPKGGNQVNQVVDLTQFIPSAEHRRHIRLFQKSDLTDEQDVVLRCYVIWKRRNFAAMSAAAAIKRPPQTASQVGQHRGSD